MVAVAAVYTWELGSTDGIRSDRMKNRVCLRSAVARLLRIVANLTSFCVVRAVQ